MKASAFRRSIRRKSIFILLPILAVSCTRDDRVATVACDESHALPLPVEIRIFSDGFSSPRTGYLDTWDLPLGSIVRLSPDLSPASPIEKLPFSTASTNVLSRKYPGVDARIVANLFNVHVDNDIKDMAKKSGVKLDYDGLVHPMFDLETPTVNSLITVDSAINTDEALVNTIRERKDAHYAIVSRTIDGDDINLFFDLSQPVVNSYDINGTRLHINYSCAVVDEIRIRRRKKGLPVPIVIFLAPVIYDESGARLRTDTSQSGPPNPSDGR